MKKIAFSLIASLGLSQAFGATSALSQSLIEYDAILNAISGDSDFKQLEFVVDIKRITEEINTLGRVKYKIVTKNVAIEEESSCSSDRHHRDTREYIAILNILPNPGIGPRIVQVLDIEPIHHRHHHHHND